MQSINVGWFSRLANAFRPLATGAFEADDVGLEILGVARTYLFTLGDKNQFPNCKMN